MSSAIANLQAQASDALLADPFFANITVLTENSGDIINEMTKALGAETSVGGKAGGFVLIITPDADANFPDLGGPYFDDVKIHAQVTTNVPTAEDPTIGIGVTGLEISENVCRVLAKQFLSGATAPLSTETPTIKLVNRSDNETTHLCRFKTQTGLQVATVPKVATVVISENAGVITLTCATAGAAIFYTLDGSNAMPRNGTLYTAPFTPGAGQTLKARAWLAGYIASDPATTTT